MTTTRARGKEESPDAIAGAGVFRTFVRTGRRYSSCFLVIRRVLLCTSISQAAASENATLVTRDPRVDLCEDDMAFNNEALIIPEPAMYIGKRTSSLL